MLTISAGIFLRLTRATNEDVPVGALLAMILLCDFALSLTVAAMLIDGPLVPLVHLLVQGLCR